MLYEMVASALNYCYCCSERGSAECFTQKLQWVSVGCCSKTLKITQKDASSNDAIPKSKYGLVSLIFGLPN